MTTQTRIKGDDGRWHEQGCPYVADDESDQVLADYGECVCAPLASPPGERNAEAAESELARLRNKE